MQPSGNSEQLEIEALTVYATAVITPELTTKPLGFYGGVEDGNSYVTVYVGTNRASQIINARIIRKALDE